MVPLEHGPAAPGTQPYPLYKLPKVKDTIILAVLLTVATIQLQALKAPNPKSAHELTQLWCPLQQRYIAL